MALAPKNKSLAVWPNSATYSAGEAPYMVGEVTMAEAKEGVCNAPSMKGRRSVLIAHRAGPDWIPDLFINADTGNSRPINKKQGQKYLNKRNSWGDQTQNDPVDVQEPVQEVVTPDPVPEVPDGELVLRVTPHVADLLRDAFTLVAAGRSVTIQTVQQPQQ